MDARQLVLTELRNFCRFDSVRADFNGFTWSDSTFFRVASIRIQQGDGTAWSDFVQRLAARPKLAMAVRRVLVGKDYFVYDFERDQLNLGRLPLETISFAATDLDALMVCLCDVASERTLPDELPHRQRSSEIRYVEFKGDSLAGPSRIGRVSTSRSRKTIYYKNSKMQSLQGSGYKANFFDVETGAWYWLSECRKDGQDTLYPGIVEIDTDVREEYWLTIRNRPDLVESTSYRSEGKYSKRRPK